MKFGFTLHQITFLEIWNIGHFFMLSRPRQIFKSVLWNLLEIFYGNALIVMLIIDTTEHKKRGVMPDTSQYRIAFSITGMHTWSQMNVPVSEVTSTEEMNNSVVGLMLMLIQSAVLDMLKTHRPTRMNAHTHARTQNCCKSNEQFVDVILRTTWTTNESINNQFTEFNQFTESPKEELISIKKKKSTFMAPICKTRLYKRYNWRARQAGCILKCDSKWPEVTWKLDPLWQLRRQEWHVPGKHSDPGNCDGDWQRALLKVDRALEQQQRPLHYVSPLTSSRLATSPGLLFNKPVPTLPLPPSHAPAFTATCSGNSIPPLFFQVSCASYKESAGRNPVLGKPLESPPQKKNQKSKNLRAIFPVTSNSPPSVAILTRRNTH